ncbi:hypothetical protein DPMN_191304 [Dreissena polymorpha]|uniref:Uncharacterized protein n=1 Tax=Dreissena polymorpha TaxID=45954 RepID=A0A9D3Y292_DREPO|nr:hypothetical protein DPMN_191304 [Dreissena polymorpha]
MKVDIGNKLDFPSIVQTNLRSDIVLWSETGTHHYRFNCEDAFDRKNPQFTELLKACNQRGCELGCSP